MVRIQGINTCKALRIVPHSNTTQILVLLCWKVKQQLCIVNVDLKFIKWFNPLFKIPSFLAHLPSTVKLRSLKGSIVVPTIDSNTDNVIIDTISMIISILVLSFSLQLFLTLSSFSISLYVFSFCPFLAAVSPFWCPHWQSLLSAAGFNLDS